VDTRELLSRNREQPERVVVAEIVVAREGKLPEIVQRRDLARLHTRGGERVPVEENALAQIRDELAEPARLECSQIVAREGLELGLEDHV
jgi:hypothetical protein